jgi:ribonuclease J
MDSIKGRNGRGPGVTVIPMGGLGEIGMNMMLYVHGDEAVIVDAGILFPDDSMPGVDHVIPDISRIEEQCRRVLGIVLTHGHEDHIGALPYLLEKVNAPVYATSLTMGLAEHRLEEYGVLESTQRCVVAAGDVIKLGPFLIEFIGMCHSVADSVALAITTPEGVIIHTGDFKFDHAPIDGRIGDLPRIAQYGRSGVLALFSDSTNSESEGLSGSESSLRAGFVRIFREAPGRIFVATFASNIHRIQQVLNISKEFGRRVVLVGRSMITNVKIASDRGYLDIPEGVIADVRELDALADTEVTVLSTGSQGEPLSALFLMAYERHKTFKIKEGDTLILSSRFIPGNEKAINSIINEFCRQGARVEYDKVAHVHVSGHAMAEELRAMIRLARPLWFMPIHGEYRHLRRHAEIAVEEGVSPERIIAALDGDVIRIGAADAAIVDHVPVRRLLVDGTGVGDVGEDVLRDRRALSEVGLVLVGIAVAAETGELLSGPEVVSKGVTFEGAEGDLMEGVKNAAAAAIAESQPRTYEEWEAARETVRLAIRRHVNRTVRRKPLVQTIIMRI